MDGFAVRVERAIDANFLAFVRLDQVLAVNVKRSSAGVLQHVFVADFHDRTGKGLNLGLLRLRLRIWRGLLCRRLRGRLRIRGLLRVELNSGQAQAQQQAQ